jgi:poly(3-hydroxybutyrate) depolymerase
LVGTPREAIEKAMAPGGHIGLFMSSRTLQTNWPQVGKWMLAVQRGR